MTIQLTHQSAYGTSICPNCGMDLWGLFATSVALIPPPTIIVGCGCTVPSTPVKLNYNGEAREPTSGFKMISPNKVVVSINGYVTLPHIALDYYGITPDIAFVRNDGWVLGAPAKFEEEAYRQWSDKWTHYQRKGEEQKNIAGYKPKKS